MPCQTINPNSKALDNMQRTKHKKKEKDKTRDRNGPQSGPHTHDLLSQLAW